MITEVTGPSRQDRTRACPVNFEEPTNGAISLVGGRFIGAGELGTVRLLGAHVGGQLKSNGAVLTNQKGPALLADGLSVASGAFLRNATFLGEGKDGTVRLIGAHIGGELNLGGATLVNSSGPALAADGLTVDGPTFLGGTYAGRGEEGAVRLHSARLTSLNLNPDPTVTVTDASAGKWVVDGLTYSGLPIGVHADRWLTFLRKGTTKYAAQPYQHLAAAHRAAGHESDARKTLMSQREDQIARAPLSKWSRAWLKFTGLTLGYGYQPWRALVGLLIVVTIAITGCLLASAGLQQPATATAPATACDWAPRVAYALNTTIPLVATTNPCQPTDTTTGTTIYTTGWALSLTAWALLTLFIAGFTNAIRKT